MLLLAAVAAAVVLVVAVAAAAAAAMMGLSPAAGLGGSGLASTQRCADPPRYLSHLANQTQITRGLLQKYGADRVRDTPITEVRVYACV